jgi:hypothetical protein
VAPGKGKCDSVNGCRVGVPIHRTWNSCCMGGIGTYLGRFEIGDHMCRFDEKPPPKGIR